MSRGERGLRFRRPEAVRLRTGRHLGKMAIARDPTGEDISVT